MKPLFMLLQFTLAEVFIHSLTFSQTPVTI